MTRDPIADLLRRLGPGYRGARARTLAGDASSRTFHRLFLPGGGTRIVMDYGAPFSGDTDDVILTRIFADADLPVPSILEVLPEAGCLVLEDLGDRTLEAEIARLDLPADHDRLERLYREAVTVAIAVADRGTTALRRSPRAAGPALDEARFRFEMEFFAEHYVRGLSGRALSPELGEALVDLADAAAAAPRVLCHRDFHSRNLMVRRDGGLAMVDLQDARWGPDTYDVASLLRDAYVDLEDDLAEVLLEEYRSGLPSPQDPETFRARFEIVSAHRMLKALGTFGYQIHVLGRERYRSAIPRTLERLARLLPSSPRTSRLGALLEGSGLLSPPPRDPRRSEPG